jgi:hypothetical protein
MRHAAQKAVMIRISAAQAVTVFVAVLLPVTGYGQAGPAIQRQARPHPVRQHQLERLPRDHRRECRKGYRRRRRHVPGHVEHIRRAHQQPPFFSS